MKKGSESLVEKKRREREKKRRERRKKQQFKILLASFLLILILLGLLILFRSDIFKIREDKIVISGNHNVKRAEILKILDLSPKATIFTISTGKIGEKILQNPWIARVKVGRRFPNGLVIKIYERKPLALVSYGDDTSFLVDDEGYAIAAFTEDKAPQIPLIHDLKVGSIEPGKPVKNKVLKEVLIILQKLPDSLYKKVKVVSAPKRERITLYTDSGLEILFGSSEDANKKVRVLSEILKREKNLIFVDLRVPDNPVVKTVGKE